LGVDETNKKERILMRYTVEYVSLVDGNYITLNIGDVVVGIDFNTAPDSVCILRINKEGRYLDR